MHTFKEKTAFFVDANELEKIIVIEYGFKEYSIVAAEELGNYQRFEVRADGILDDFEETDLTEKNNMYNTRVYINDLVRREVIPKGLYIINTSW